MYAQGDSVKANMPSGWLPGHIVEVFHGYGFSKETKYLVHGEKNNPFITIVSARNLKPETA